MRRTESQTLNIKEHQNHEYFGELQSKYPKVNFRRLEKTESKYNTNNRARNVENENVFSETQIKKALCAIHLPTNAQLLRRKFLYFSQNEAKHDIYKFDDPRELHHKKEKYAIQFIGHSTMLIQVPGFNILTDPVFNGLDKMYYPEKTKSFPCIQHLPKIDIILISHNHRDHVDRKSLQEFLEHYRSRLWSQPRVLVPFGDKRLLQTFGFHYINELDWYSKMTITKRNKMTVNVVCIPGDQRSGRNKVESRRSLVTGWIINPEKDDVIFKYAGDTRALSQSTQLAIDAALYNEITLKSSNVGSPEGSTKVPKIICFEPSGPNYTRCTVESNHQSTSYSALLKFVEASNLHKISGLPIESFLPRIKTVMFHHNKFQLGPDRFNEGIFIVKKLYNYLHLDDEQIRREYKRQTQKLLDNVDREKLRETLPLPSRPIIANLPPQTSILVRAKDFIIQDLRNAQEQIDLEKTKVKQIMICYLLKNTVFPMIGERMTGEDLASALFNRDLEKYNGYQMQKQLNIESTW